MIVGSICVAYKEERFIQKHLRHLPEWVQDPIVLNSRTPWNGDAEEDSTEKLAESISTVYRMDWKDETQQRNMGQRLHQDKDWIIVMDPDEFLTEEDWVKLYDYLQTTDTDAVCVEGQHTYWKSGYVADPPKDYPMLIAVKPHVKFVDKRVVDTAFSHAPVWVHHFSWARTDEEVLRKITHYGHAHDFDTLKWYESVWKKWKPGDQDVHPVTPDTLHNLVRVDLPKELRELNLWP